MAADDSLRFLTQTEAPWQPIRIRRLRRSGLVAAVAGTIALTGCGRSNGGSVTTTPPAAAVSTSSALPSPTATAPASSTTTVAVSTTHPTASAPPTTKVPPRSTMANLRGLKVSLKATPDPVAPGHQLVYTITVVNTGSVPFSGVKARFPLPDYVSWDSWSPNCQGAGPTFFCLLGPGAPTYSGPLQPGQSQSGSITLTVEAKPTVASFSATVVVTGNGPSGQQTATATASTKES